MTRFELATPRPPDVCSTGLSYLGRGWVRGPNGPEATAGIEPAMRVLQTLALPLGYVATVESGEGGIRTRDGLAPATA